jgi:parvulin-like peptidyl-prolyl isomerase
LLIGAMREYFKGLKVVLLFVIVAFIATSLFYFGSGSLKGDGARSAAPATVNGEEVPAARFRLPQDITPEMAERGLFQQVISDLVQEALIIQRAREGITVSDEELRLRIQSIPAFQEDGRFSRERYMAQLKQARIDPGEFETEVRRDLVRQRMEALVKDGIKVSDAEVEQAYMTRFERVRADWASIESAPFMAQVTVSDADAEAYVKTHEAQFSRPERRRIQYVLIAPKTFAKAVPDADAEAYYKEHRAEFEQPKRLKTSHILVRVPPTGGSEAESKSKTKIEEAIRRAKAGEDLASRQGAVGRHRDGATGRRSRLCGQGRDGAPVRGGGVRAEEGGDLAPARAHAVRLPRHHGLRRAGRRRPAASRRGSQDQGEARHRAQRARRPGKVGRGEAGADRGERLCRLGEKARDGFEGSDGGAR